MINTKANPLSKKIVGILQLFRLELPLAAGICVVTGQIIASGGLPQLPVGVLAFVCIFCVSSAALIFNDYFDYEVDKINAPDRALPSGLVSPSEVIGLGVVVTLIGFLTAYALSFSALLISVMLWVIGFVYNWRYKQTGLLGNLMVSVSVAATFVLGAFSVQDPWNGIVWVFALMAFFLDLGEEIAGDAMDMEGDKKIGSQSIALRKGRQFAVRVSAVLWSVVVVVSFVPSILGWLGAQYLVIFLITDAILVYFLVKLLRSQNAGQGHQAMRGAYLGETLCVFAVLVSRLIS